MWAKTLNDLQLWQRANEFWDAVNAIIDRTAFQRDVRLRNQIRDASDSMLSNISEGFEQPTDRSFARYLYHSKGSTAEIRSRLRIAAKRKYITIPEFEERDKLGDEVARMTVGLIKYLLRSNRRNRGLGLNDEPPADC
jgi:four helix bundle protein